MEKSSKLYRKRYSKLISILLVIYDSVAMPTSYFLALWLRFDLRVSQIDTPYLEVFLKLMPIYVVGSLFIFWFMRMYRSLWEYVSMKEGLRAVEGSLITSALLSVSYVFYHMPRSFYFIGAIIQVILIVGGRFAYRFILFIVANLDTQSKDETPKKRIMVIGAGDAGQMIMKDIRQSGKINKKVVCIIDDNPDKWNRFIDGVPIVGGRDEIVPSALKYDVDSIYIAIPSASAETKKDIINICTQTDCNIKNLPGMFQFVTDEIKATALKDISVEDLLGREPIKADMTDVFNFISGKTILVTGGGGSIGSELCRQIAAQNPKKLIILEIYENNAYDIQFELKNSFPSLDLKVLIGSVRDSRRLRQIFSDYRPEIVYHAAAHKHVPLMEDSPNEAIKNNVIGTYKTAYASFVFGVERFVLISTDKAVNPTNIMGASKRLCEMIIQAFDKKIKDGKAGEIPKLFTHAEKDDEIYTVTLPENISTEYVAVRFGNVLGSNGSVIPVFKKQIEKGGPVTVTHPDIIRYFMTISEAVSLVLTAGTFAKGGEIFVLDMGSPVKIDSLARSLIKLSGYKPDVDIKIEYTGLRPGEKLFEEKLLAEEGIRKTKNELIYIGSPIPFDIDEFNLKIQSLMDFAYDNSDNIKEIVAGIVSTYKPEDINS